MTRHFDYLLKDADGDFFQKVAMDESGVRANHRLPEMTKTASQAEAARTPFEKVASRLERDIYSLKVTGECGINAGMQKRANAYIDVLLSNADLSAEQFAEVFDKVASEAIQTDLVTAYDSLCIDLPEHEHPIVDEVLIKIGHELAELALMEKDAFLGALRGLGRAAHGAQELSRAAKTVELAKPVGEIGAMAKARSALGGAKEVATAPFRAAGRAIGRVKETAGAAVSRARAARSARIQAAPAKFEAALAKSRAAERMPGVAGTAARGASKSLEKQLGKAQVKATADAAKGAKMPARQFAKTEAAPAAKTEAKAGKAEVERQQGETKAQEAAKPPGEPPKTPKSEASGGEGGRGSGGDHTPPPPGGAEGKPPGFMDAWKKATESGWKQLSPSEKGVLIRGGVTAALVTRAVTGHGAITGGEGLI